MLLRGLHCAMLPSGCVHACLRTPQRCPLDLPLPLQQQYGRLLSGTLFLFGPQMHIIMCILQRSWRCTSAHSAAEV